MKFLSFKFHIWISAFAILLNLSLVLAGYDFLLLMCAVLICMSTLTFLWRWNRANRTTAVFLAAVVLCTSTGSFVRQPVFLYLRFAPELAIRKNQFKDTASSAEDSEYIQRLPTWTTPNDAVPVAVGVTYTRFLLDSSRVKNRYSNIYQMPCDNSTLYLWADFFLQWQSCHS